MKDFILIKDPEIAKLFADPTRRRILHNLKRNEMTAYQLAKALGKSVSSIVYHLNMLEKAGLVEQSRVNVKGNLIERFYRASAKMFIISYVLSEGLIPGSEDIAKWSRKICERAVSSLNSFGYYIPPEEEERWVELMERYMTLEKMAYEEVISRQIAPANVKFPSLQLVLNFLAHATLHRNPEYIELMNGISEELIKRGKRVAVTRGES